MTQSATAEFDAIKAVHEALQPLDDEARSRVVKYIVSLLSIDANVPVSASGKTVGEDEAEDASDKMIEDAVTYSTFAELYAAANPTTNGDKALIAGYWLQVCQGSENFTAQSANKELTHLGHKVANITAALDTLKSTKPALILQLRKSGSSQQARKTYKVSAAGVKRVEEMIGG